MKQHYLMTLCFLFTLLSCSPRQLSKTYNAEKIRGLYSNAIADSAKPSPSEVYKGLIAIKEDNTKLVWKTINGQQYVLVSSWQKEKKYYKNDGETGFYNTSKYPLWVTAIPEVQEICRAKKFGRKEGLDLRLKQLIGLPPDVEKNYFVEFWVQPKDLFRPCPDREITDSSCDLCFPENTDEDYLTWFKNQRNESYYNCLWNANYPWTQLGYTYDWNRRNKQHIGLSEFIIGENTDIVVHKIYTTEAYCQDIE